MNLKSRIFIAVLFASLAPAASLAQTSDMVQAGSDIPAKRQETETGYDYVKCEEMIPMRDGVKLHTVIVVPKGAHDLSMLLERTPYNAGSFSSHDSPQLHDTLWSADREWVDDGYIFSTRTDVLSYQTSVLTQPVHVEGAPFADIFAKTTGTDGDFVVKIIDVYPPTYAEQPEMGGYQLPISMDIFRGRYRKSFAEPSAVPAGEVQEYRFRLPAMNCVFKRKATVSTEHGSSGASAVLLPVVEASTAIK